MLYEEMDINDYKVAVETALLEDEQLMDEIVNEIESEKRTGMKNIWYAVQIDSTDAWDYGSYDYDEAVEMLNQQGRGQIAIINEDTSFCEGEISFEEAVGW